jgi:hypothetical protein
MRTNETVSGMLGKVNNLSDPIPLVNKPALILGVCITLQVRPILPSIHVLQLAIM